MSDSFATPWTVAHQAPLSMSMGFPKQEYWSSLPFPSPINLPNPGIQPVSLNWQVNSLLLSHQKTHIQMCSCLPRAQSCIAYRLSYCTGTPFREKGKKKKKFIHFKKVLWEKSLQDAFALMLITFYNILQSMIWTSGRIFILHTCNLIVGIDLSLYFYYSPFSFWELNKLKIQEIKVTV